MLRERPLADASPLSDHLGLLRLDLRHFREVREFLRFENAYDHRSSTKRYHHVAYFKISVAHPYRVKLCWFPASTFKMFPVDFAERSLANQ